MPIVTAREMAIETIRKHDWDSVSEENKEKIYKLLDKAMGREGVTYAEPDGHKKNLKEYNYQWCEEEHIVEILKLGGLW